MVPENDPEFTLFPMLSIELRLKIWKMALLWFDLIDLIMGSVLCGHLVREGEGFKGSEGSFEDEEDGESD